MSPELKNNFKVYIYSFMLELSFWDIKTNFHEHFKDRGYTF